MVTSSVVAFGFGIGGARRPSVWNFGCGLHAAIVLVSSGNPCSHLPCPALVSERSSKELGSVFFRTSHCSPKLTILGVLLGIFSLIGKKNKV